jgi:hypothetical protein
MQALQTTSFAQPSWCEVMMSIVATPTSSTKRAQQNIQMLQF